MKKQQKVAIGVGAGVTALAAAATAAYLFTGKRGKSNRAKVSKWAEGAKADIVKQLRSAKQVSQQTYNQVVDTVVDQYKKAKKANPQDLVKLANELKGHWNTIAKEATVAARKVVPAKAVRSVKKAIKKALPKATLKKAPAKKVAKKKAKK
jgi:gas vesicle protein